MVTSKVNSLWPTRNDFKRAWPAVLRGTGLGSLLGILPGGGALLSSFAAYTLEKKISRHPEQFGKGAVEGVAGLKRRTMPAPRPRSFHADARHSFQRGHGHDDRRDDIQGIAPGPQ